MRSDFHADTFLQQLDMGKQVCLLYADRCVVTLAEFADIVNHILVVYRNVCINRYNQATRLQQVVTAKEC